MNPASLSQVWDLVVGNAKGKPSNGAPGLLLSFKPRPSCQGWGDEGLLSSGSCTPTANLAQVRPAQWLLGNIRYMLLDYWGPEPSFIRDLERFEGLTLILV